MGKIFSEVMTTIKLKDGTRITREQFDKRIHNAKKLKIEIFLNDEGYLVCEDCRQNDCKPIDCSHDVPVSECIKSGHPELAYDVKNITLRGRLCHKNHDKLNIHGSKIDND